MDELDALIEDLRARLHVSRITVREDVPGDYAFPVTHETLAPGVGSIAAERTVDLRTQPVVRELVQGRQVVQADCRSAFTDPAFLAMLDTYGGLAAQVVTPIFVDERLTAILSVHQLGEPRVWSEDEVAKCTDAADRIGKLI